jgi:hypothetical protein
VKLPAATAVSTMSAAGLAWLPWFAGLRGGGCQQRGAEEKRSRVAGKAM